MKTSKLIVTCLCCAAAAAFTACTTDDENTDLTPQERQTAYNTVKGEYAGSLLYNDPAATTTTDRLDTVAVHWTFDSDTTMMVRDFPSAPIAASLTDTAMARAVGQQSTQVLRAKVWYYAVSPVGFLVNPIAATYNVNYGGADHKVQVAFYVNTAYSFGTYSAATSTMQIQMLIGGIYVDGTLQRSLLNSNTVFGMVGKK